MSYRLLLPSFEPLSAADLEGAMTDLKLICLARERPRWQVRALAWEEDGESEYPLVVSLCTPPEITPKTYDNHFYAPRGVRHWVEVRISGGNEDRQARLRARLTAMVIANRLGLPILETRNGVYCRTAEAFVAWCSREPHPQTVLLAEAMQEHLTDLPPRPAKTLPPGAQVAAARPDSLRIEPDPAPVRTQHASLPPQGWFHRLWRRLTGLRPHVIRLPRSAGPSVVDALVAEVEHTFQRRNVVYDADAHRLVIYAADTQAARTAVSDLRQRPAAR